MKTLEQIIAGVRLLLRRPSDIELPDEDIRKILNDNCAQYVQQQSLAIRNRTSKVVDLQLTEAEHDFAINFNGAEDFEEQALEFSLATNSSTDHWYKANIVPLSTWATHFSREYVAASFYGVANGVAPGYVKINLTPDDVLARLWRLTYREPMVLALQYGNKPPLPAGHMPMLEREAACLLMPLVRNTSAEWLAWCDHWLPLYETKLLEQKRDWQSYLDSSDEPQEQPLQRSDRHGRSTQRVRPFVPLQ